MPEQSIEEYESKYSHWVKNDLVNSRDSGSCNASSHYTGDTSNASRLDDYYICGENRCYSMTQADWETTYGGSGTTNCTHSNAARNIDQLSSEYRNLFKTHYDPCINMPTWSIDNQNPSNQTNINTFDLGMLSGPENTFRPGEGEHGLLTGVGDSWYSGIGMGSFTTGGGLSDNTVSGEAIINDGRMKVNGITAAYPNNKTFVTNLINNEISRFSEPSFETDTDEGDLHGCPQNWREFTCVGDGHNGALSAEARTVITTIAVLGAIAATISSAGIGGPEAALGVAAVVAGLSGEGSSNTPGCGSGAGGFFDWGATGEADHSLNFCARNQDNYDNVEISKCCLGKTASGPTVDSHGNPSNDYKHCPSDYCATQVRYGEAGVTDANCSPDSVNTNGPAAPGQDSSSQEQVCYKMNNKCNDFFRTKCSVDVFKRNHANAEVDSRLYEYCVDWANIREEEFQQHIAPDLCDLSIADSSAGPTPEEVIKIKNTFQNPLCRKYLLKPSVINTKIGQLRDICKNAYQDNGPDSLTDRWTITNTGRELLTVCPCYLPQGYYDWWQRRSLIDSGTCSDSNYNTREECEGHNGTWTESAERSNQQQFQAAIDRQMNLQPACYFPECTRSLMYDPSTQGDCSHNLQLCYQEMNITPRIVSRSGVSRVDLGDLDLGAHQSCNQQQLLSPPAPDVTPAPVDGDDNDDGGGIGGILGGIFGGGSDSGSGSGSSRGSSGSGDSGSGGTVVLIVLVVFIIILAIIGVMYFKNKGESTPS